MSKRKQQQDSSNPNASGSDSDSSDVSFVDVDFEFFDPNPKIDYHAFKRLFTQLFQTDAEQFDLSALVELVLSQSSIGTTIKTDGEESDPYALLTVLNMHIHQNHSSIAALASYFLDKTAPDQTFNAELRRIFAGSNTHVGLILCERLINMPVQTIPPMYRMLSEELKSALSESQPFAFTHLLFVSRAYHLSDAEEEALANRAPSHKSKKPKKAKPQQPAMQARPMDGVYSFHPEDTTIQEYALHSITYPFSTSAETRDAESFGLDVRGRLMLVEASRWEELVAKMSEVYLGHFEMTRLITTAARPRASYRQLIKPKRRDTPLMSIPESKPVITLTTLDPALPEHLSLIPAIVDIHIACIQTSNTIATFSPPLDRQRMVKWWAGMVEDTRTGSRIIFLAFVTTPGSQSPSLAGYVILYRPRWETGPFRGVVEKLLVSPSFRRLDIATRLMAKLEADAKVLGQTLLTLDTETGSPAELIYPKLGYNLLGVIPDYGISPLDKSLKAGTFFWKQL
ncbi:N-acetyltransferase domain-containing protein [Mycena indigotica]|uniref:N-acetyltransferase domain-containing protein n=1 Tax=Mycena indigotica TaxID=2126181 RepID=A0A8H6W4T5_9AGAR|nr:N-acetyltransferase domain-containing protein [Mycena indigotica]KAF7299259.1 N-acetyltransferase domain-containing protein [Mycena indigotica]